MRRILFAALCGAAVLPAQFQTYDVVYRMSNDATRNEVVVYVRSTDSFVEASRVATGGRGTGRDLLSQGAVTQAGGGRFLLAVNPGSDQISLLRRGDQALQLVDVAYSGGEHPTCVLTHDDFIYVANGTSGTVARFRIVGDRLEPVGTPYVGGWGSSIYQTSFSGTDVNAALIATIPDLGLIARIPVAPDGSLGRSRNFRARIGRPTGFTTRKDGVLVVAEADARGRCVMVSYRVHDRRLEVLDVAATGLAAGHGACLSPNGSRCYVAHADSRSISAMVLAEDGRFGQLGDGVAVLDDLARPMDLAMSPSGLVLYAFDAGMDVLHACFVKTDGTLQRAAAAGGFPYGGFSGGVVVASGDF